MLRSPGPFSADENRVSGESGQALVESALVLPLAIFLVLGTLQLFMMLQARIMTEYAAYRATRAGSVNHGDCTAMVHAALAPLLPTFTRTDTPARLGDAFALRRGNRFGPTELTSGADVSGESIVWVIRQSPTRADIGGADYERFDYAFDAPPMTLEVRLVFWFPLRIPFADWVITRMMLAHYGMQEYAGVINPLSPAQVAQWPGSLTYTPPPAEMAAYAGAAVAAKFSELARARKYLFPIQATHAMRMMTPPKQLHFPAQNGPCQVGG